MYWLNTIYIPTDQWYKTNIYIALFTTFFQSLSAESSNYYCSFIQIGITYYITSINTVNNSSWFLIKYANKAMWRPY